MWCSIDAPALVDFGGISKSSRETHLARVALGGASSEEYNQVIFTHVV